MPEQPPTVSSLDPPPVFERRRRSRLERLRGEMRAWARVTFSRESFVSSFKSLLWVVPLTVLIWMYAENESINSMNNVTVTLEVPSGSPEQIVRFAADGPHTASIEMQGPQGVLDSVRESLERNAVTLDVDRNLAPGEHQIEVAEILNRLSRLRSAGVTVTSCVPPTVTLLVDPIVDVEVEVRAPAQDTTGLSGPPVFTPSRVKMSIPRSALERADRQGRKIGAVANLRSFAMLSEPGKHDLQAVPLTPSIDLGGTPVVFSPPTVAAHVEVPNGQIKAVLNNVIVWAAYPESRQADQYKATYDYELHPGVTVTGPADKVNPLEDGSVVPIAIFRVDLSAANSGSPTTAPLLFDLPPGVHLSDEDAHRTITYTLTRRSAPEQ